MEKTKVGSKCWNSTVQGKDLQKGCSVSFNGIWKGYQNDKMGVRDDGFAFEGS